MKPLTGLTVLDFSHVIAGPLSTFYLAQLGARVIKIEQPGPGDVLRGTAKGATQFAALNAGKDFAQIDLKSAAGRAEALALATTCDVLVDNFRPGGRCHVRRVGGVRFHCSGTGFARARDPAAFKVKLAAALKTNTAAHWEAVCNAQGIPAARVRDLAEFTREAVASGALVPTQLQLGDVKISTPGLGWTCA